MALGDLSRALQAAYQTLPSYNQLQLENAQIQGQRTQNQALDVQNQERLAAIDDDNAFHVAARALPQDAQASDYSALMLRHPKKATQIKSAYDMLEKDAQRDILASTAQVYSAIHNQRPELAIQLLERRQASRRNSGLGDDPEDSSLIEDLRSGDPTRIAQARHAAGLQLAAVTGPEKFSETYNSVNRAGDGYTLNAGDVRYGYDNKPLAAVPYKPQALRIRDGGTEKIIEWSPGMSLPEGVSAPEGVDAVGSVNAPRTAPGATRGIRNNNPGNLEDTAFSKAQPGYVGTDGRFAIFANPAAGVAAQEKLLDQVYYGKGLNTIGMIVNKYAPGSDGNDVAAYSSFIARKAKLAVNQPIRTPEERKRVAAAMRDYESRYDKAEGPSLRVIAQGAPKPGYRILTPAEVARMPLDPSRPWQMSGDGRISPIGPKPAAAGSKGNNTRANRPTVAGVVAPILKKVAEGKPLTPGEQNAWNLYRSRAPRTQKGAGAPPAPSSPAAGPVRVKSKADLDRLPVGAIFIGPDGKQRRKQ